MTFFTQLVLSGLMIGGIYALIALGFVLIYKASGVFNFAQGELLLVSAYFCWTCLEFFPLWLSFLLTFLFAIGLGIFLERFFLRPMIGQTVLATVMVTIGLSAFLRGFVVTAWGGRLHRYPDFFPFEPLWLGEVSISQQHLYSFLVSLALVGIFVALFRYARIGLAMRAVAEDHQGAQGSGISVKRSFMYAWVISCVVSAVGGVLLGSINGIQPQLSFLGLKVLPVVLLGGLDSVPGAIIAGLIVGVLENIAGGYIDPIIGGGFAEVFPFVILMFVLIVRPYGLFGLKRIERV